MKKIKMVPFVLIMVLLLGCFGTSLAEEDIKHDISLPVHNAMGYRDEFSKKTFGHERIQATTRIVKKGETESAGQNIIYHPAGSITDKFALPIKNELP